MRRSDLGGHLLGATLREIELLVSLASLITLQSILSDERVHKAVVRFSREVFGDNALVVEIPLRIVMLPGISNGSGCGSSLRLNRPGRLDRVRAELLSDSTLLAKLQLQVVVDLDLTEERLEELRCLFDE